MWSYDMGKLKLTFCIKKKMGEQQQQQKRK